MGEGEYKHLEWAKSPGVTDRRRRPMRAPPPSVPDPAGHASALRVQLGAAVARSQVQAGYDARVLLKIDFSGRPPAELESIPGLEVVSEEPGKLILVFSTEEGRQEFARRLDLVARGSTTTRANLIFATQGIDAWTSDDRTTVQLAKLLPELVSAPNRTVRLDVELWPLGDERPDQADRMLRAFSRRAEAAGLTILDQVRRPMVLVRVEGSLEGVRWLLDYRDVREVTTPPNFYLSPDLRRMSLRKLKPVAPRHATLQESPSSTAASSRTTPCWGQPSPTKSRSSMAQRPTTMWAMERLWQASRCSATWRRRWPLTTSHPLAGW